MGQLRKTADTDTQSDGPNEISFSVDVKDAGRILLPANVRAALGVSEGDTLYGDVRDGELRLMTSAVALRKTQERLKKLIPRDVSLVDQLIADRRAEAAREEEELREYLLAKNARS